MALVDVTCVIHAHSLHSDGTGTVAEIAAAGARAGVDAVLLTDHDTLEARRCGEERWHGPTLVCVGEEVSPVGRNHYLAFGLEDEIDHAGLSARQLAAAVADAGGFGFFAHPFSHGSRRFARFGHGMPWEDLEAPAATGLELWSFVTDTAEALRSIPEALAFAAVPARVLAHPPRANLAAWDRLTALRPVVAIGGIDAHQIGRRVGGRGPLRLMSYQRSFRHLRTHVLVEGPLTGDAACDRDAIYAALRAGRCHLAVDSLADSRGFRLWAEDGPERCEQGAEEHATPTTLIHARLPRPAALTLIKDGEPIVSTYGSGLDHHAAAPGAYRLEAMLAAHGRIRTWIISNPLYLR